MLTYGINKKLGKQDTIIDVTQRVLGEYTLNDNTVYMQCYYGDSYVYESEEIEVQSPEASKKFVIQSVNYDNHTFIINVPYYQELKIGSITEVKETTEDKEKVYWYFYCKEPHQFSIDTINLDGTIKETERTICIIYHNVEYILENCVFVNANTIKWEFDSENPSLNTISFVIFGKEFNENNMRGCVTELPSITVKRKSIYTDKFAPLTFIKTKTIGVLPLSISQNESIDVYQELNVQEQFVEAETNKAINSIIEMEKDVYYPYYKNEDNEYLPIKEIEINLHFRKHKGEDWTVTNDDFWNGIEAIKTENTDTVELYINEDFYSKPYKDCKERQSDNLSLLGFSNSDIRYQKAKLSKSFIRLSYYDTPYSTNQTLLDYSTPHIDTKRLFTNYIKNLETAGFKRITNNGEVETNIIGLNVLNEVDNIKDVTLDNIEDYRLSSQFLIKDKDLTTTTSEGFYLYLWRGLGKVDEPQDIYLHIDFNHSGYGRIIPMMLPYKEKGIKNINDIIQDWVNGGYSMQRYLDYSYIHLQYMYSSVVGKYIYLLNNDVYGADGTYYDDEKCRLILNVYETKISDNENEETTQKDYEFEINTFKIEYQSLQQEESFAIGKTTYMLDKRYDITELNFSLKDKETSEILCDYKYDINNGLTIKVNDKTITVNDKYGFDFLQEKLGIQIKLELVPIVNTNNSKWISPIENSNYQVEDEIVEDKTNDYGYIKENSTNEYKFLIIKDNTENWIKLPSKCNGNEKQINNAEVANFNLNLRYKNAIKKGTAIVTNTNSNIITTNVAYVPQDKYRMEVWDVNNLSNPLKLVSGKHSVKVKETQDLPLCVKVYKNDVLLTDYNCINIEQISATPSLYENYRLYAKLPPTNEYTAGLIFESKFKAKSWAIFNYTIKINEDTTNVFQLSIIYVADERDIYDITGYNVYKYPVVDNNVTIFQETGGKDYELEETWLDSNKNYIYFGVKARKYPLKNQYDFYNEDLSSYNSVAIHYDDVYMSTQTFKRYMVDGVGNLLPNVIKWEKGRSYQPDADDLEYFIKEETITNEQKKTYKLYKCVQSLKIDKVVSPHNFDKYFREVSKNENNDKLWNPEYKYNAGNYIIYEKSDSTLHYYYCIQTYDNMSLTTTSDMYDSIVDDMVSQGMLMELNEENTALWRYKETIDKGNFVRQTTRNIKNIFIDENDSNKYYIGSFYIAKENYGGFSPSALTEYFNECCFVDYDNSSETANYIPSTNLDFDYVIKLGAQNMLQTMNIDLEAENQMATLHKSILTTVRVGRYFRVYTLSDITPDTSIPIEGILGYTKIIKYTTESIYQEKYENLDTDVLLYPQYDIDNNNYNKIYTIPGNKRRSICLLIEAFQYRYIIGEDDKEYKEMIQEDPIKIAFKRREENREVYYTLYDSKNGSATMISVKEYDINPTIFNTNTGFEMYTINRENINIESLKNDEFGRYQQNIKLFIIDIQPDAEITGEIEDEIIITNISNGESITFKLRQLANSTIKE